MVFNWLKFWKVGNHLQNFSKKEGFQRSAVGRYYYTCFLLARDLYELSTNSKLDKKSSHKNLIVFYNESSNENFNKIGEGLSSLERYRINADYERKFNFWNVKKAENESKRLISLLNDTITNFSKFN